LHVSGDPADRSPLVLGHDRKRTLTADVGDGNGRLGLAGAEQLLHGYRASVLGKGTHPGQLFGAARATGFTRAAGPFGTQADVDVVIAIGGDKGADLIGAEGD